MGITYEYVCVLKVDVLGIIRAQAASFERQLRQVQLTVDGQNQTVVMLQQTVDDKCDVIERQQMALEQLNDTLQFLVDNQGSSNGDDLSARFPREYSSF